MQRQSIFIFTLLFVLVTPNTLFPLKKIIKLAIGVSKAAYLPLAGKRFIQNGHIIENPSTTKYDPTQDTISCSVGGWNGRSYENKDTEVLLYSHPQQKLAVFGFRGTEPTNINDWIKNFKIALAEASIGSTKFRIHEGFRDRYLDISSWFEAEYQAIPHDYTIILTGHSLGGALATISAAYASGKLNRRPDAVVTFGSPLVGKQNFKDYYNNNVGCDRTLRITAKDDVFTKVPPKVLHYTHVCNAHEVKGFTGWFINVNFVATHSLYDGYDRGLAKRYKNLNEINYGCDRLL